MDGIKVAKISPLGYGEMAYVKGNGDVMLTNMAWAKKSKKKKDVSADRNRLMSSRGMDGVEGTRKKAKKRKKASGTQTAAQKRNIARLKKVQKIAKQLKASNPRLSHTEAVKRAWKQA